MPAARLWKHTFPDNPCRDAERLIPTRETRKHRGAVACKRCLDWLARVDDAAEAPHVPELADQQARSTTSMPMASSPC